MDPLLPELAVSRLCIVDRDGRARIVLELEPDGAPAIRLLHQSGQVLARLGLSATPRRSGTGSIGVDGVVAALQLGAADRGAQFTAQAGLNGEGFLELASAPAEDFAAVLFEVDQTSDIPHAQLLVRDHKAVLEIEVRDGAIQVLGGGGKADSAG